MILMDTIPLLRLPLIRMNINIGMSWHVSNLSNYPNPQGFASFAIFNFGYMWAIPHFEDTTYYDILGGVPKIGLPPNHPNSVHGFSNNKPPSYSGTAMTIFKLPHHTQKRLRGPDFRLFLVLLTSINMSSFLGCPISPHQRGPSPQGLCKVSRASTQAGLPPWYKLREMAYHTPGHFRMVHFAGHIIGIHQKYRTVTVFPGKCK